MGMSIPVGPQNIMQATEAKDAQEAALDQEIRQLESEDSLLEGEKEEINPFTTLTKKTDTLRERTHIEKLKETTGVEEMILPAGEIDDATEKFKKQNPEIPESKVSNLVALLNKIKSGDSKENILAEINKLFPNAHEADEALKFLMQTTKGALANTVKEAQGDFEKSHSKDIQSGKKDADVGRVVHREMESLERKGLGEAKTMFEIYCKIKYTSLDTLTLFEEFSKNYNPKEIKALVDYLLHGLGADLKKEGATIPSGLESQIMSVIRSLQAGKGVTTISTKLMVRTEKEFKKNNLKMPQELTATKLAEQFMLLAQERYISPAKVLQTAEKLGINNVAPAA